jgi:hypothetical protein
MCKVYFRNCHFCEYYEELKTTSNYYSTHFEAKRTGPETIQVAVQKPCGQHENEKLLMDCITLYGTKKAGSCKEKVEEKEGSWESPKAY